MLPCVRTNILDKRFDKGVDQAMPRIVRDTRLETRESRRKLNPAGKPYWRLLDEGLHIGYRKGQSGGKWVVRRYVGAQEIRCRDNQ